MNKAATTPAASTLERAVRSAKERYPDAEVKVRRGRLIIVRGNLIGLVPITPKPSDAVVGDT